MDRSDARSGYRPLARLPLALLAGACLHAASIDLRAAPIDGASTPRPAARSGQLAGARTASPPRTSASIERVEFRRSPLDRQVGGRTARGQERLERGAAVDAEPDRGGLGRNPFDSPAADRISPGQIPPEASVSGRERPERHPVDLVRSVRVAPARPAPTGEALDRALFGWVAVIRTRSDSVASDRAVSERVASERVASDRAVASRFRADWTDEPLLGAANGPGDAPRPAASLPLGPWFAPDDPSENARQLLRHVEGVGAQGLDPARYDIEGLREGIAALFHPLPPRLMPSSEHAARAALAYRLNRSFERLLGDLGRGVVDARAVQSRLYRDRPDPDTDALIRSLERGDIDVDGALRAVGVSNAGYARLTEAMRGRLAERAAGGFRTRVDEDGELRIGQRHGDVMRVRSRLIETGDLDRSSVSTPLFDDTLARAVTRFQRRHGIAPSGRIEALTRAALNRTLEQEMDDLAASLERWRWMPRELGERHVFVNLPDYRLHLNEGEERLVDMAVVIGATDHPTPSFSREMSYMEFNPTWTVPRSIANEELVPLERRRPGYLKSREFDFLKVVDGRLQPVPHEDVTPEDLLKTPFPYVLRQRGGPINALGRMKFMMPNPYAIYLHDTQAKRHFTLHDRAYSHGCIRLSDPDTLAKRLMRIDGRSGREVERALAERETTRVRLRSPVPTHLAYFTAWVDEGGEVQRRADVYGHDPALREALRVHGALPSAWLARRQGRVPEPEILSARPG